MLPVSFLEEEKEKQINNIYDFKRCFLAAILLP
jgi:hypothetical protein